jgi:predicted permease
MLKRSYFDMSGLRGQRLRRLLRQGSQSLDLSAAEDSGWERWVLPAPGIGGRDARRLALGMALLGLTMAGLNLLATHWLSKDAWLSYTTFVDTPLAMLGAALGPMALLLVGVTLSGVRIGEHLRSALALVAAKNFALPLLVAAGGWALGLSGLPLWVVVTVAALPAGANSFLFSQRYQVAEDTVTTTVGLSTLLALVTVPVAIVLVRQL